MDLGIQQDTRLHIWYHRKNCISNTENVSVRCVCVCVRARARVRVSCKDHDGEGEGDTVVKLNILL